MTENKYLLLLINYYYSNVYNTPKKLGNITMWPFTDNKCMIDNFILYSK